MRVFAVSDLHVDYKHNYIWLTSLSQSEYQGDILIVAGDISHKIDLFESSLKYLSSCFKQVLYVPGNHDLWLSKSSYSSSLEKFYDLL